MLSNKLSFLCIITIKILLFSPLAFSKPIKNQLQHHASPYLAMHGSDPVQWQDWNENVVRRALKENKLIYISSGYFSCHWCHVMQRESYKNKAIARILNQFFIPVKIDRELNPALDARLIDFVERTQGQAGWPLNVFITPEGYPLVGMTYLPAKNFSDVLNNLKEQWAADSNYLKDIANQATIQLLAEQKSSSTKKLKKYSANSLSQQFLSQAASLRDDMQGGFGEQTKFPAVPQLHVLLNIIRSNILNVSQKKQWTEFLITTLDSMANLGLNDHINGGFFRYTVDPNWQIPHFEKMLYDNTQLAILYFEAAKYLNRTDYTIIAEQTLQFLQTDMTSNVGVIAASLSAVDTQGVEGGYYVFQQGDFRKYLTNKQYNIINKLWKLVSNDALESGYHVIQVKTPQDLAKELNTPLKEIENIIQAVRIKLRSVRAKKNNPIDTKPVAAWLGLSLHAFTLGAQLTENKSYQNTADKLYKFISSSLWKNNTLYRSIQKNKEIITPIGTAGLEDYAFIASGINIYATATKNTLAKAIATNIAEQAWLRFYKKDGWYLAEKPLIKYTAGKPVIEESPLPSPSATLIRVSLKLQSKKLKMLANKALHKGISDIEDTPYWYATQVDVIREFYK